MISLLALALIVIGSLIFLPMLFLNQVFVKKYSNQKLHHIITYLLFLGLLVSFVLIVMDFTTEDASVASGFRGLRGFLAFSSFAIYLFNQIILVSKSRKLIC